MPARIVVKLRTMKTWSFDYEDTDSPDCMDWIFPQDVAQEGQAILDHEIQPFDPRTASWFRCTTVIARGHPRR
jgi:hypothetical protein